MTSHQIPTTKAMKLSKHTTFKKPSKRLRLIPYMKTKRSCLSRKTRSSKISQRRPTRIKARKKANNQIDQKQDITAKERQALYEKPKYVSDDSDPANELSEKNQKNLKLK